MLDLKLPPQLADKNLNLGFSEGPVLRSIEELEQKEIYKETVLATSGAEVIFANYELLQHDFPCLKTEALEKRHQELTLLTGLAKELMIRQKIEEWLIRHTCFVSENQASQTMVNTEIPLTGEKVEAYRPILYGRALVFSLLNNYQGLGIKDEKEDGLLDVKGTGLEAGKEHRYYHHGNGLISLAEVFFEYLHQQMIEAIFRHSGSEFETLPTYAIIKLGFEVKNTAGNAGPAGLLVRRAHRRPELPGGLPMHESDMQVIQLQAELLLRRYGITSTSYMTRVKIWRDDGRLRVSYGGQEAKDLKEEQLKILEEISQIGEKDAVTFEGVNIQHTKEYSRDPWRMVLIDFGTFKVVQKFENPILSLVADKLLRWGGAVWPDFKIYPQPDPLICAPFELWGDETEFWGFPERLRHTKPNIICDGLAMYLHQGKLTKLDVMNVLHAFLSTSTAQWGE